MRQTSHQPSGERTHPQHQRLLWKRQRGRSGRKRLACVHDRGCRRIFFFIFLVRVPSTFQRAWSDAPPAVVAVDGQRRRRCEWWPTLQRATRVLRPTPCWGSKQFQHWRWWKWCRRCSSNLHKQQTHGGGACHCPRCQLLSAASRECSSTGAAPAAAAAFHLFCGRGLVRRRRDGHQHQRRALHCRVRRLRSATSQCHHHPQQ
jgi:hypothetical protein